jgi:hypothetical protein
VPRLPDVLFAAFALALIVLAATDFRIAALALAGAFVCGAVYLFTGMIPARSEPLALRLFTTVFLSVVLSCLVVILPGTVAAGRPDIQPALEDVVVAVALLLPFAAVCFEVARTPRVLDALRSLRSR